MASTTVSVPSFSSTGYAGQSRSSGALWFAVLGLLCAAVYVAAYAFQRYGPNSGGLAAAGLALLDPSWHNIGECVAIGLCLAAGLLVPRCRPMLLRRMELAFAAFAARRTQAILFAGAMPLLLRIALLPVLGIPEPLIADEFGYLLLADTFASGRLANPTHPIWSAFETIYVFHQPTYSSIYPVAPAIPIAVAKLLGLHPWIGVWFAAGVMCALICWMLQGWLPPKWAFLGSLLAVCRFTIVSPWMNSYWGGAVAAVGGALVLGSLPRIRKWQRRRDALWFGLGLVILAQSRPFEGVLFSIPLLAWLAYWLLAERRVAFRIRLTHVALPIAVMLTALVAGSLWYNSRTTGSPFLPPYLWNQQLYGTPQTLVWQAPVPDAPGVHRYQDIADVFRWQLAAHQEGFSWSGEADRLNTFWLFYLQPLLTVPLLLLPLVLRNRRMLVLGLSAFVLLAGNAMYSFFFAHYAAPLCGLMVLLIVSGLRYLRLLRFRSAPAGAMVFRGLILCIAASTAATAVGAILQPIYITATSTPRGLVLRQLKSLGGKHLVLVRYSPTHRFDFGVVFNDADLVGSPVVWARQRDSAGNQALANYYADRRVWLFNPDESPVSLLPYTDKPYITAVAAGAGRREDTRDGVSPGSIAVLLGANFADEWKGSKTTHPLPRLPLRLQSVSPALGNLFEASESEGGTGGEVASIPLDRAGVSVDFGGIRAPVLAVSNLDGQESVTVQVPARIPAGETTVTLRARNLPATRKVTILPASPGVLQMRMADGGIGAIILHPDGSLVDFRRPAHPGETLRMFATGLGPPDRQLIVGFNAQGLPLISARAAEGMPGVEEITFQLPADTPAGPGIPLSVAVVIDGQAMHSNKSQLAVK